MAEKGMLEAGRKVRDYKVTVTDGNSKKLSEFMGKKGLILYFYPRDSTPGCTTEACDFRDNTKVLTKLGYNVVGVSADSPAKHVKFTEKQSINFPLISDEDQKICNAFGVWQEKKLYGKVFMGIVRSTFILDANLKITMAYPKVKVKGHVEQIISDLGK